MLSGDRTRSAVRRSFIHSPSFHAYAFSVWMIDADNLRFEMEGRGPGVFTPAFGAPDLVQGHDGGRRDGGAAVLARPREHRVGKMAGRGCHVEPRPGRPLGHGFPLGE